MQRGIEEEDGWILVGDLVFLRKVVVKSGDVATDDERGAVGSTAGVWKTRGDVSAHTVFKREADEEEQEMCADMKNDVDGSGREDIVKEREM